MNMYKVQNISIKSLILLVFLSICFLIGQNSKFQNTHSKNPNVKRDFNNISYYFLKEENNKNSDNDNAMDSKLLYSKDWVNKLSASNTQFKNKNIEFINIPSLTQTNNIYCVPASVQSSLLSMNLKFRQEYLAGLMNIAFDGVSNEDMLSFLNNDYISMIDDRTKIKGTYNTEKLKYDIQYLDLNNNKTSLDTFKRNIKTSIAEKLPFFITISLNSLYPMYKDADHMILCFGYIENKTDNEISHLLILDTLPQMQNIENGGFKIIEIDKIFKAVSDNIRPAYFYIYRQ